MIWSLLFVTTAQSSAANKRPMSTSLRGSWRQFGKALKAFERQLEHLKSSFAFWFVEGTLVKV